MRKKFALNLAILIGANLLIKPFWIFGIDRVVQNTLGAESYGLYFAVFNYSLLFSVLLDLGLNNFNNRAISRVPSRIGQYFGNLFTLKISLSAIYFLFTLAAAFGSGFNKEKLEILSLLLVNQILLTLILFFRSNLQALQRFKADSFISIADRLLAIGFCAAIIWFHVFELSIASFILAQTAALFITCVIAGILVGKQAGFLFSFWDRKFRLRIFRSTFPYALLVFLMTVYGRIDAILLDSLLGENGAYQAGIYAASFRIFDAANQFGFLFSTILLPLFAANFKQQKKNDELVQFGLQGIMIFSVSVSVICVIWSKFLLQLLYHQSGQEWQQVFIFTMLAFIPASLIYIMGTLLTAKGAIYTLCKISVAGVFFNFFANYFSIPIYGAVGSAATALATNVLVCLLHVLAVAKQTKVTMPLKSVASLLVFIILSFATCYGISLLHLNSGFVSIGLSGVVILLLAIALQILPLAEIKKVVAALNSRVVKRSDAA